MKYKTTNKAVNAGYVHVLRIGYCDMQNLLHFQEPVAYTCGVNGWNADIYAYGHIAICTGYRPTGDLSADYDTIKKYEDEAEKIVHNRDMDYEERKAKVNALLDEFMQEVMESVR